MPSYTLIKTIFAEDSECGSKTALQVCALRVRIAKIWWTREIEGLVIAKLLTDAGLERRSGVQTLLIANLRCNCRWRSHGVEVDGRIEDGMRMYYGRQIGET